MARCINLLGHLTIFDSLSIFLESTLVETLLAIYGGIHFIIS
jgi:hypothetical protein